MSASFSPQKESPVTDRQVWRTLIVDDHPLFRNGLRELIESIPGFIVCGEADSEEQAFQELLATGADLVTVDISLASGNGLSLIERIKNHSPSTVVLVLSMYEDSIYAERALAAGAAGYVCKHADTGEFRAAFEAFQRGEVYVSATVLQRLLARQAAPPGAAANIDNTHLSGRELQIFTLIGQGRTTPQIARELRLAVSTVETYRERLKSKLKLSTGAELTRLAILRMIQNA
jgi:DNA-binding NarL/FixJ family response regulator